MGNLKKVPNVHASELPDVSQTNADDQKVGKELIQTVIEKSGVPEDWGSAELEAILTSAGESDENLTLDQLKDAMIRYLEHMARTTDVFIDDDFDQDTDPSGRSVQ